MENLRFFAVNYLKPAAIKITFYSFVLLYSTTISIQIIYDYFFNNGKSDKYFWKPKSRPIPPKLLTDPSFGTHHYVQLPNVKLHYVEAGSKDRPLMIFIHGFPEFWYSWRHQMEEFSKDHWVVAFDTRGCGDSEKPHGIQYYKLQHLVTDLKNLLDALGRQKCILVAHDWGGVIAWEFLSKYPEMVEKYIIMNAPHPLAFRKHVYSSLKQFKMSWYMLMFQMFWLPEFYLTNRDMKEVENLFLNRKEGRHVYNEEEMEAVKFMWGKPGAFTTSLNYYRANVGMVHRKAEQTVPAVEPPKGFLIFGEDDSYLDARPLVEKSTQRVPTLKTLLIPGACHFVQEDVPDVVNKAMREFLAQ